MSENQKLSTPRDTHGRFVTKKKQKEDFDFGEMMGGAILALLLIWIIVRLLNLNL